MLSSSHITIIMPASVVNSMNPLWFNSLQIIVFFALFNKYTGNKIAIITKSMPANPNTVIKAFGIRIANKYAGKTVNIGERNLLEVILNKLSGIIDLIESFKLKNTPTNDVITASNDIHHIRI